MGPSAVRGTVIKRNAQPVTNTWTGTSASAREAYVDSHGVCLWTVVQGTGVPLLLCNGGPGCCDYLAPVAELWDDVARVIRFEERGCGRSERRPPYALEHSLVGIESIRQQYGVERWIVAGHSWGATLALIYAVHHPER